jgi:pyruvate dehydrogenase E2 component (dihydrolipoamide acetyltransferase)
MAETVLMPKQGNSVETCILLEWKKQEGDPVKSGEVLCEAETDKATIEVESTADGILLKQLYHADDEVPVMVPIALIGEAGEQISDFRPAPSADAEPQKQEPADSAGKTEPADTGRPGEEMPAKSAAAVRGISPRARKLAGRLGVSAAEVTGTGPGGRVIERDIAASASAHQPLTPAAAALAAEGGYTLPVSGSGAGGRILTADLKEEPDVQPERKEFPGPVREVPLRGIRKVTARRMLESITQTCQLTLNASAEAFRLKELRTRFKQSDQELGLRDVSINDLILFAAVKTLQRFSYVNSHFLGDRTVEFTHVHLGQAVDTERGLMVPVIRFADQLTLTELSRESRRLAALCREGKAAAENLEGGTFTVTNLGVLGVESFTPVLSPPQTAILGVGAMTIAPKETESGIEMISRIGLSLTFDHQAFDGAPAARFLQALTQNVRDIDLLLMQR